MESNESKLKGFSEEEKLLWGLDLVRAKREGRVEDIPKIMKKRSEYLEIREKCLTLQEQISDCRYNEFEKKQKLFENAAEIPSRKFNTEKALLLSVKGKDGVTNFVKIQPNALKKMNEVYGNNLSYEVNSILLGTKKVIGNQRTLLLGTKKVIGNQRILNVEDVYTPKNFILLAGSKDIDEFIGLYGQVKSSNTIADEFASRFGKTEQDFYTIFSEKLIAEMREAGLVDDSTVLRALSKDLNIDERKEFVKKLADLDIEMISSPTSTILLTPAYGRAEFEANLAGRRLIGASHNHPGANFDIEGWKTLRTRSYEDIKNNDYVLRRTYGNEEPLQVIITHTPTANGVQMKGLTTLGNPQLDLDELIKRIEDITTPGQLAIAGDFFREWLPDSPFSKLKLHNLQKYDPLDYDDFFVFENIKSTLIADLKNDPIKSRYFLSDYAFNKFLMQTDDQTALEISERVKRVKLMVDQRTAILQKNKQVTDKLEEIKLEDFIRFYTGQYPDLDSEGLNQLKQALGLDDKQLIDIIKNYNKYYSK